MVFKSSADDLPFIVEILRTDEADDTVDEKWVEGACDSVGSRFEGQLIGSVMRFGGESATLAGFEVHDVVAYPADIVIDIALAMMCENLFPALAQHVQSDSEAAVGGFRPRDGLEKKVDRRPAM